MYTYVPSLRDLLSPHPTLLGHQRESNWASCAIQQALTESESGSESHSVVSDSLRPHGPYRPWNSSGQNTRVGSRSLLRGIFPIQGSNPDLPHCRWILDQLSHKGSPGSHQLSGLHIVVCICQSQSLSLSHPSCPPPMSTHLSSLSMSLLVKVKSLSHVWLFATPWTVAY